jgi:hypothetical protein
MPAIRYTPAVGSKFHQDGSVRTFPGNTIICAVDPQRQVDVYREVLWAQNTLRAMACSDKFAFLPPESFHMTVMELLCDQVRTTSNWSDQLSLNAPLDETDRFFMDTVVTVPAPTAIRMRYSHMRKPGLIALEPADQETVAALAEFRDGIAQVTGLRFPNHDSYGYHISLVYNLVELDEFDQTEVTLTFERINERLTKTFGNFGPDAPELVFFDNMFRFVPASQRHTLTTRTP